MKCFLAFATLTLLTVPLVGGFLYLLCVTPHLAVAFGCGLLLVVALIGSAWAIDTAGECWRNR
jgi:hypothetical protein